MKMLFFVFLAFVASTYGFHIPGFINGKPMRYHIEKTLFPEIKDADCSHVNESYFTAKIDNFDPNSGTWQQKYQLNNRYYKSNTNDPVVFLMIGGEGTASVQWVCWENYTYMELASKYSALVIQLEHRFFGYSYPKLTSNKMGDMSTKTLSLLTSQQALADLANFIRNFKYNGVSMTNAKWVVVGGSYPGSLCAWFRAQYSDLSVGGICSSAPLWAKVDFYEYAEVMEFAFKNFDPVCAKTLQQGFAQLKSFTYTDTGRTYLNKIFNIKPSLNVPASNDFDFDATNFLATIFSYFQGVVQYTFDARSKENINEGLNIDTLCNMTKRQLNNDETTVDLIKDIAFWIAKIDYNDMSNSIDNNYTEYVTAYGRSSFNFTDGNDREIAAGRGWMWLCCGMALGWLQTTDNANSIFNRLIPLEYYLQQCTDLFGQEINTTYVTMKTAASAAYFKNPWNYTATNVLLPNGNYDPWHALGSYVNNTEKHQVSLLTPKAAHCSDMYPMRADEPTGLNNTRAVIRSEVDYYITKYTRASTSGVSSIQSFTILPLASFLLSLAY